MSKTDAGSSVSSLTTLDGPDHSTRPYHWTDLFIGLRIVIASVDVMLIDADDFTREFYASKGMELADKIEPEPEVSMLQTMKNANASMKSSGKSTNPSMSFNDHYVIPEKNTLIPQAPPKDGAKLKALQGLCLRFHGMLAGNARELMLL